MILVDTSVWVDHLRYPEANLKTLLDENNVLMHPMVIGELACGNMRNREGKLKNWRSLPRIYEASHEQVISLIEIKNLMGRGLGFVDMHLLCSVLHYPGSLLWTRDQRLNRIAGEFNIAFETIH